MCSNVTPQASPSAAESTGRAIFSRLAAPLRSSTRFFSEFYIQPFEPHRQYAQGDAIRGMVVLAAVKPVRITHLTVALYGFVRVYKNQNAVAQNVLCDPALTGSSDCARYFGNGHASLFQDEITLSGERRLDVGLYEFEFNLYLPSKGVPTSIDFERGTISYMIRATITRPTSISPISTCERKVSLVETIDIGSIVPPKSSIIYLEPISKRARKSPKPRPRTDYDVIDAGNVSDGSQPANSSIPEDSASQCASLDHSKTSRSPVGSDVQSESGAESIDSSKQSIVVGSVLLCPQSGQDQNVHCDSMNDKTITAKIELLKGGCLPGDNLPLKISIQHTKRIKSMNGIIVTLYRQGRIDSAPPLSLFTNVKGKAADRLKHEEYYPKSKTGFGGLSLSSAGSSSVFRKDLSQRVIPIIFPPSKLSTVVTASIRVPEYVFPTITGVPGQMISFRYHIEVLVDLGGRLAGHKQLQRSSPPKFRLDGSPAFFQDDVSAGVLSAWEGSIVDTDYIRREKGVVACLFEVVVGTKDSARLRRKENPTALEDQPPIQTLQNNPTLHTGLGQNERREPSGDQSSMRRNYFDSGLFQEPNEPPEHYYTFEPPHGAVNEALSEKDRVRLAEERLLPSQPPQDESSTAPGVAPSAPGKDLCEYNPSMSLGHPYIGTSAPNSSNLFYNPSTPSAPLLGDLLVSAPHSNVDKQELERRRLMAETSSPSDFPEDQEDPGEGSSQNQYEPTAPVLTEEAHGGNHISPHTNLFGSGYSSAPRDEHNEFLPKYER